MPSVPVPPRACTLALPRRCQAALNSCACTPAHPRTRTPAPYVVTLRPAPPRTCTSAHPHTHEPALNSAQGMRFVCIHPGSGRFSPGPTSRQKIQTLDLPCIWPEKYMRRCQKNLPTSPSWRQRYRHKYPAIKPHPSDFFTHRHPGLDLRSNSPIYDGSGYALKGSGTQGHYVQITTVRWLLRPAVAILAIL